MSKMSGILGGIEIGAGLALSTFTFGASAAATLATLKSVGGLLVNAGIGTLLSGAGTTLQTGQATEADR
jgi:hypothetical protein